MKSVLITGAGSGIGFSTVKYLAERDYKVYAAVRNPNDFDKFGWENVEPLLMDVTKVDQIDEVQEYIYENDKEFYAVINNAGVGPLGFFHTFSEDDMMNLLDINALGPWRVTNHFLPHLLRTKGQVITIGSRGGMITKALFGPYSMTKFALEAYTDALRQELSPHGVNVSLIQPGGVATAISEKSQEGNIKRLKKANPPFKELADSILEGMNTALPVFNPETPESEQNRKPSLPTDVAKVVYTILTETPKSYRYLVSTKWEGNQVIDHLIHRLLTVNENPKLNYSIDELIERINIIAKD